MILKAIKLLLLVAIVLLLGQISVAGDTIAGHFQRQVRSACARGGEQLLHTKLLAGVSESFALERWLHNVTPPKRKVAMKRQIEEGDAEPEAYSSADRESIMRLLQ